MPDLLAEEHIVVLPMLANAETLLQTTIFVGLGEQPWSVHKRLACVSLAWFG